ncbi:aspartic peptidase domain-containing protein [Coniochaeta sp. 2T2.1]|nr:aspartic peptidase domain-containing protein [Coniochaeta sp. 2T2.1]
MAATDMGISDVNFDTAADDLLIPTVACTTCDTQQWPHPLFDPAKSSTFLNDPGTSFEACFGTGGTSIPFDRFNPQCANITLAKDRVCIRDLCSPVQDIALGTGYDPAFMAQPFDGILGMNIENATTYNTWYWNVYQSGQLPSPEFAFYIEPREVHGSQITLGGVDKSKYKGDITTIPLSPIATHPNVQGWVLQVPALYVEGQRVVNTTAPGVGSPLPFAEAKLDMATSFMGSPNFEATRDLYAIISPEIIELDRVLGIWGATCDVVDRVAKDVVFTVGAPGAQLNLTVPKAEFNAGPLPGNETFCQAIYVNLGGARERANRNPGWVFGAPIFKNYYTVWNGRTLTFGVARPKWKKASAP